MKVLIFSVSAGGGHGHAAEAIKNYIKLENSNSEVRIIDTLKYINPVIDKVVIGSYLKTLKVTPFLYGKLYSYSEGSDPIAVALASKLIEALTSKLLPLIDDFNADILISTHSFTTEMLSVLKFKYNMKIPCMSIITDFYPHSTWLHPYINAYVVSNKDMIEKMVSEGIKSETIYDLGIPVNPDFHKKYSKENTLNELNLSASKFTILIMGGSLGMGKIKDIYEQLNEIADDIQIIIITGKNKKLYSELLKLKKDSLKATSIIGFTDHVNKYMQCSDILLTKSGGLTITEALICNLPLGIFSPIPGQEERNAEFLFKNKLAIDFTDISKCGENIERLLKYPEKLTNIAKSYTDFSKPDSGYNIVKLIHSLIDKKNTNSNINSPSVKSRLYEKEDIRTLIKSAGEYFLKTANKLFESN
ncbi:processive 1,2-diacylglycerol beta-glucosyltransferase [Clostridium algifaecis]|uniref:Processive 1,2-diacylglycerol beta-glucosyltransferase n=1 Tax=Clostridium algifaecis TaxID=1472040 RepID=A0ABS4KSA2_9CLOT|nr:glycosyltransferase [Clostridium algifaecis]MBP2032366.1 processive 1,2-diacylglycerol beta-glucosyltransferase [Clostridium algifaecis]